MKNPPDRLAWHDRHGPEVRLRRANGECAVFLCDIQGNGAQRRVAAAPTEWGLHPWWPQAAEVARGKGRVPPSGDEWFADVGVAVGVGVVGPGATVRVVLPLRLEFDVEAAVNAFGLSETERAQLRRLFARSDEVRYSGAQNGGMSPQDRHEVLALIENLRA